MTVKLDGQEPIVRMSETLKHSLFLVRTTNGDFIAVDGETLIQKSDPVQTDAVVNTNVTGIATTHVFRIVLPRLELAADVYALLRWQVTAAGGAGSTGRINLDIRKEGVAITGLTKASGTTRALDAIAGPFDEVLHVLIPKTAFGSGERLDFRVEIEVVAPAVGNATVRVRHDPATAGSEAIVEVNV